MVGMTSELVFLALFGVSGCSILLYYIGKSLYEGIRYMGNGVDSDNQASCSNKEE